MSRNILTQFCIDYDQYYCIYNKTLTNTGTDNIIKWTLDSLKCQYMPNAIEQICLKVIYKAQNNAKDSKGLNHGHVHMQEVSFMEITVLCKLKIVFDFISYLSY